jgi:hypothetical protein
VDLIDLFTPRVLTPTTAIESLPDSHSAFALTRWMVVPYSLEERGYRFTTHGLRRFGLPELQALDVPGVLTGAWTDVMCGIATRLLDEWIEAVDQESPPSFVEIPAVLGVSEEDVARAFGGTPRGGGAARVRLRLDLPDDPDGETFLTVVPPLDFARSAGEHAAEVSEALFGVQRGDIRVTERSEAMDQAIEVARAGLAQVRQRFRTGELDRGAELIVKHRLPTPTGGNENVWATISDWSDPALLLGTSMNDAQTDPSIRLGRPVRIAVDDVIDWALWRGDEGIVEGG